MTKDEVWSKFCEVNPSFNSEYRVEMSVDKIRKMVETAYKYGNEAGFENGKRITEQLYRAAGGGSSGDLFNQIFGGKK